MFIVSILFSCTHKHTHRKIRLKIEVRKKTDAFVTRVHSFAVIPTRITLNHFFVKLEFFLLLLPNVRRCREKNIINNYTLLKFKLPLYSHLCQFSHCGLVWLGRLFGFGGQFEYSNYNLLELTT